MNYPEAHTIDGEKVPPDGTEQPLSEGGGIACKMKSRPIGLSYPAGQDFGPYIQYCGEGLMPSFMLDFANNIPFSCGNVHPHTAIMLYALALNQRPKTIIETGTFYGYSTFFLAQALKLWNDPDSQLYTIDPDDSLISEAILRHPFITVVKARSELSIPTLISDLREKDSEFAVDFAFIGSWKRLALAEFILIYPFIPYGGIVVFHDTQFLNTGHTLYTTIHNTYVQSGEFEQILFSGTPDPNNPHKYFGNADDRGLMVIRKKEPNPFLEVKRCF